MIGRKGRPLNKEKCTFLVDEIKYLAYNISQNGIEVLPSHVSALIVFTKPCNKESLMQFLGVINYVS